MRGSTVVRVIALVVSMLAVGCRGSGSPTMVITDPNRPDQLPACPTGQPHLVVPLAPAQSSEQQVLWRFTRDFAPCQGVVIERSRHGEITAAAGLPDGTDVVGFDAGYSSTVMSGVVRFNGGAVADSAADPDLSPIGLAAVTFGGAPAVAITWGEVGSSSSSPERIDIVSASDLTNRLGSWPTPSSSLLSITAGVTEGDRLLGLIQYGGVQEYRAEPASASLATTGEIQLAVPTGTGNQHEIATGPGVALAATDNGVMFYRPGTPAAMLGPRYCRWPAVVGSPLPAETADYLSVTRDLDDPTNAAVVLVRGDLDNGSTDDYHLFRLGFRGECEWLVSFPSTHYAGLVDWAGR